MDTPTPDYLAQRAARTPAAASPAAALPRRVAGMLANYPFVTRETLAYFDKRPPQANRDSAFALAYVKRHATTAETQRAVLDALLFKCDVLWSMLDALYHAYVAPKHVPPGAFVPEDHGA